MFAQTYLSWCLFLAVYVISIKPVYLIPQCHDIHEFFNTAAAKCTAEPTCQNITPDAECGCVEDNCQQRCECKEGYIRDETKQRQCVPLNKCPCTECGEHEVLNTHASTCKDEPTCENQTPQVNLHCTPQIITRCECAPGYVRGPDGTCICPSSCPCVCGENEVFNTCASTCDIEPTCDNPTPEVDSCCVPQKIQRCECAPGYIRDASGNCICIKSCPCPHTHNHHKNHHVVHYHLLDHIF